MSSRVMSVMCPGLIISYHKGKGQWGGRRIFKGKFVASGPISEIRADALYHLEAFFGRPSNV